MTAASSSISSGAISGVGFAIAKTTAPPAIARIPSRGHGSRPRETDVDVGSRERLIGGAAKRARVRLGREHALVVVETGAAGRQRALAVAADDIVDARGAEHASGARRPRHRRP